MEKQTYSNAGSQRRQGRLELLRYGEFDPDTLVTLQCVAMVLSIRLQMVKQIPVPRQIIDKRVYYRKGDIETWLAQDLASPDSLICKLRAQHAESIDRIVKQPSRLYVRGQPAREKPAKDKAPATPFAWSVPSMKKPKSNG